MQEGRIVGLFCRFVVVDRNLEVEEVESFDRARVPRVEHTFQLAPPSIQSSRPNRSHRIIYPVPENESHKLVSKWATPSFTESNLSQVEPARNPFDAPDAMFVFTH